MTITDVSSPPNLEAGEIASKRVRGNRRLDAMALERTDLLHDPHVAAVVAEERCRRDGKHAFIAENGCALAGRHHEIYLGDPRRAAPEKLRTILRQPVA